MVDHHLRWTDYFYAVEHEIIHNDIYNSLVFGGLAGIAAKTVIAPGERVKMLFQVSSDKFTVRGAFSKAWSIVMENGVLNLWRGHSATVIRVAPYAALSYALHDFLERSFQSHNNAMTLSFAYRFLAGSISGIGATIFTYPLDSLRIRIAMGIPWFDCLRKGRFYQGMLPTLLGKYRYCIVPDYEDDVLLTVD
jgi:solute carrier family 25 protein 42